MFVLGIDPGLSRCGYGCVTRSGSASGFSAVAAGVVTTPPDEAVPQRLALLRSDLDRLMRDLRPDVVVIERIFFRSNARTAMSVGQASGVALLTAFEHGCEVAEYTAAEVKLAVTGYGNAPKEQVQAMIVRLFGLTAVPRPPDVADALALALCHIGAAPWEQERATLKGPEGKAMVARGLAGSAPARGAPARKGLAG